MTSMSFNAHRPVGTWVLLAVARPRDQASSLKRPQLADHEGPRPARGLDDVAGARTSRLPDQPDQVASTPRQARFQSPVHGCGGQYDPDAPCGLVILRIGEPGEAHLLEHPADAFTKFLAEGE